MTLPNIKFKSFHFLWIFASFWSLLLLTKYIPFIPQPQSIIGYLWKYEFAIAFFLGIFCFAILKSKVLVKFAIFERDEFYFIILPIFLFILWSFLSIIWSNSERHALHHSLLWACYLVFYLIARTAVKHLRLLKTSIVNLGIVVGVLGVCCVIEYLAYLFGSRETVIGFTYSKFAEIGVLILPLILLSDFKLNNRNSNLHLFSGIVIWLLILCSFARTQFIVGLVLIVFCGIAVFVFKFDLEIRNRFVKSVAVMILLTIAINIVVINSSNAVSTITRFADRADAPSQQSVQVRPLFWGISLEMFRENPIIGVGADNFLLNYKNARISFAGSRFDDPATGFMEDLVPERSHNELLQILAELGIVGVLLFAWLIFGILKMTLNLSKARSPIAFGSIIGIYAFLLCSLATSFSFRLPANGLCFFFVLAIASSRLFVGEKRIDLRKLTPQFQPILAFVCLSICLATLGFSGIRGANLYQINASQNAAEKSEVEDQLLSALYLDKFDALTNNEYARYLSNQNRYSEAAAYYRIAIENGISPSTTYFDLATNQILAGESKSASETFEEAIKLYPRSVFLRTNFAKFLEETNKPDESRFQLEVASSLNESDTKSWWLLLSGELTAVKIKEKGATQTMDLQPLNGVYAVIDFQKERNPSISLRR